MDADEIVPLVVRRRFVGEDIPTHQLANGQMLRAERDDRKPPGVAIAHAVFPSANSPYGCASADALGRPFYASPAFSLTPSHSPRSKNPYEPFPSPSGTTMAAAARPISGSASISPGSFEITTEGG